MANTKERSTFNGGRNIATKVIIIFILIAAVGFAVYFKGRRGTTGQGQETLTAAGSSGIPRLVDLGAGQCIPCKMMAPILSELTTEYAGRLEVAVIDVRENPAAAEPYNIDIIPTQIFYDTAGREVYRHEGFFSKEDILAKWKELGIDIETQPKKDTKGTENETQN